MAEPDKYTLDNYRQQFPELQGQDDTAVADHMHQQFYSDMPRSAVYSKLGLPVNPNEEPVRFDENDPGNPFPKTASAAMGIVSGAIKTGSDIASLGMRGLQQLGVTDKDTVDKFVKASNDRVEAEHNVVGKAPVSEAIGSALPYMLTPSLRVFGGLGETAGMMGQALGKAVDFMGSGAIGGGLAGAATASGRNEDIGEGAKTGAIIGSVATGVGGAIASQANRLFNGKAIQGAIQDIKDLSSNYLGLGGNIGSKLAQESADRFIAKGAMLTQLAKQGNQEVQLVPQSQLVKALKPIVTQLTAQGEDRTAGIIQKEIDAISGKSTQNGVQLSDTIQLGTRLAKAAGSGAEMSASKSGLQQAQQVVDAFNNAVIQSRGSPQLQQLWQQAQQFNPATIPTDLKSVLSIVRGTNAQVSQQLYSSVSPELQSMVKGQTIMDALNAATKNNIINPSILQRELTKPGTVPWFQNPQDQAALQGLQNLMNSHALEVATARTGDGLGGIGKWSLAWGLVEGIAHGHLNPQTLIPGIALMTFHNAMSRLVRTQGGMDFLAANATVQPGSSAAKLMYNEFLKRYGGSFVSALNQEGQVPQGHQQGQIRQ